MTNSQNSKTSLTSAQMNERRQLDGLFFSLNEIKQMSEGIETILDNSKHLIQPKVYNNISSLIGTLEADYDTIVNPIEDENPIEDVKQEVTNHLVQLQIESPEPMSPKHVGYEVFDRLSMLLEDEGSDFWLTVHNYKSDAHTPTKEELLEREETAAYLVKLEEEREEAIQKIVAKS